MNLNYRQFNQFFKVDKKLGEGSFGVVYKVLYKKNYYALKIIFKPDSDTIREAQTLINLNRYSLDVVKYYGYFYYYNYLCLLMEYIEGRTVFDYFARRRPITEWVKFAKWLLMTVSLLHHLGVRHRDIKPDNIIKTKNGYKLIDFGLACQVNKTCKSKEVWPKYFSAPEVWAGRYVDFKANDNYQVGATLYFILTYRLPIIYQPLPNFKYNNVLQGLLNTNVYQRLTSQQALNLLKN